jgi:hypothetical protein
MVCASRPGTGLRPRVTGTTGQQRHADESQGHQRNHDEQPGGVE